MWSYYRDEVNGNENENDNANNRINNNKIITSESFEYKTKLTGNMPNNNNVLEAEVVVPLKYLGNFWRSVDLPLINFEIKLDLSWSKEHIISEISIIPRVSGDANPPVQEVAVMQTSATFQINNAKLYVPVVTFSVNDNVQFLENIKQEFEGQFLGTNIGLK